MAHRIGRHEPIGEALWRLLGADIAMARRTLAGSAPRTRRLHRTRQFLKRARSELKVLGPALGPASDNLKTILSDAGRMLGNARDADVAAATARVLSASIGSRDAGFENATAALEKSATEAHRHATPARTVIARLRALEAEFEASATKVDGEKLLARAIGRFYEDGREAMRRAETSRTTPDLHAWRKRVKDLWHLIRLARRRLPVRLVGKAKDFERLGALLGLDHDHAVLAERLALAPEANHALMRQLAVIAAERRILQKEALALGGRLYRRKPKAFAARARQR